MIYDLYIFIFQPTEDWTEETATWTDSEFTEGSDPIGEEYFEEQRLGGTTYTVSLHLNQSFY